MSSPVPTFEQIQCEKDLILQQCPRVDINAPLFPDGIRNVLLPRLMPVCPQKNLGEEETVLLMDRVCQT
jgi:hypothetical protein